ncbi:hypothetical protein [Nonomuraea jiangxiensis]|uniref:hypothetical protein n=1 Tax=Nonomuraea jiangxiensis TaxID=633440 RepID=UPI0015A1B856|nr:hypothetical protein [Nonomuraea jiangxiensis]
MRALVMLKANVPSERSSALLLNASSIPGMSSIRHLAANLRALTVKLKAEQLSELGG